ncbi:MAG: hypothetical protein GX053_01225 [Tissierella sp.]|nr:hypothetical protein [Tissierella sp.]
MKKLLSMVLIFTLVLSMGALAFGLEDADPVVINKELTIVNDETLNPAETFNFTVGTGVGVRDEVEIPAPAFSSNTFTIDIVEGELLGSTNIDLPEFTQVGVYTYPISEDEGNIAGFGYDQGVYNLVITVINDPDGDGFLRVITMTDDNNVKRDAFKNTFSAGDLTVNKLIAGNYADPNDEFEITVTVAPIGDAVINTDTIAWNTAEVNVSGPGNDGEYTAVYTLTGGNSFTIQNLPYDVTYTVVETNSGEGYEVEYDGNEEGEIILATHTTTITNTRDIDINTGINLDNAPYVLILVGVAAGLVGFTMKRRLSNDK